MVQTTDQTYDIVILGGGSGGYACALRAAELGLTVALVEKDKLTKMWVLRRILMQMGTVDAMEFLLDKMKDSKTNEDFFDSMNQ